MKNVIDNISCCLDKSLTDNTANCCLNTKVLRYGECKLSGEQAKDIAFILAHDLLEYANNNGDMSNLSAKSVYTFLNTKNKDLQSNN
ncbi:MAG: hypothetical protein E7356_03350 [Clostridiales bacterium]|nr:hypothetical protein [Clostridiales bacterium]